MEKTVSASEASRRFSEMMRDVARGQSFTIVSGGRPVARVLPVDRRPERGSVVRLLEFVAALPVRRFVPLSRTHLYE